MRISTLGSLFAAAAVISAPSAARTESASNETAAAENASAPAETAAKPAPDTEKKICKRLEASYSHASDRVCLTKSEWKQVEEQAR